MENEQEIKKVIIPIAGLGTRFLPLSLAVSKEFFPLVDKPIIQYIIEEVKKLPLGDGHAILQGSKLLNSEPTAVSFGDDIIDSDVPGLQQLMEIFKTTNNAPVIALKALPKEKVPAYGSVAVEKISNRLYK